MNFILAEFKQSKSLKWIVLIAILAFVPTIGLVHLFDWDEINFAESAREMMVTSDYFRVRVNYAPFWEKPPLFFWLQSGSMHLFGINEFASRFPNAVAGIISILVLYFIGKKERNERFATIWSLLYLCALLPQVYFRSGIIDPIFNLFIFLSTYYLFKALTDDQLKLKRSFWAGLFCGLAVLTKGPVGFLLVFLTFVVFILVKRFKVLPQFKQILVFAITVFGVSFLWFGVEVIQNGPWFIVEFINYQIELFTQGVAGHEQPFYYHFVVVFFGTFPLSILALPSLIQRKREDMLEQWWTILFWVVLILFSITTTKIVHYSSMTYLPLSFLAAISIEKLDWSEVKGWLKGLYWFLGGLVTIAFIGVPLFAIFKDHFLHLFNDPFAVAGFSNDAVSWSGLEFSVALFFILAVGGLIYFWKKDLLVKGLFVKAIFVSLALNIAMILVVPKIETYSQGPMIDFFKSHQGEEIYISQIGFKSYAQYFYFNQPEHPNAHTKITNEKFDGEQVPYAELETAVKLFLLYEPLDYDAYFVTKIQHTELDEIPDIQQIGQKGGYKFYFRPKAL